MKINYVFLKQVCKNTKKKLIARKLTESLPLNLTITIHFTPK